VDEELEFSEISYIENMLLISVVSVSKKLKLKTDVEMQVSTKFFRSV
jgi:hypothetical protein